MRFVLAFLLSAAVLSTAGQNKISSYRYWFDEQYNTAVSQDINAGSVYTLSAQINSASLLNGLHLFNIQFRDDSSRQSSTLSSFFYKRNPAAGQASIISFQYWYDFDFNGAVTQTAAGEANFTFNGILLAASLPDGLHILGMRFKDNQGRWSETQSHFFYKAGLTGNSVISSYQYWFDQDFTGAVVQNIAAGAQYSFSAPLSAAQLPDGLHMLHSRFSDSKGKWSSIMSNFFYKQGTGTNAAVSSFQYWFDQDFTGAVLQNFTPATSLNITEQIAVPALINGLHTISYRCKETKGKWSSTVTQFFFKENPAAAENNITAYRYWFDEGDSIANLVTLAPFMNPLILNQSIPTDGIDSGQHLVHFQFRDINGRWSMVTSDSTITITKTIYTFVGNGNWSDANNWVNRIKPPASITGAYQIFIDPVAGGQCILDVNQHISTGARITVRAGKSFVIPGNFEIQP